jgi:hypothetical protein
MIDQTASTEKRDYDNLKLPYHTKKDLFTPGTSIEKPFNPRSQGDIIASGSTIRRLILYLCILRERLQSFSQLLHRVFLRG